jgi:hypothetical protein
VIRREDDALLHHALGLDPTNLQPGTVVDRFGGELGRYVSPAGTAFANRSLPPEAASLPLTTYRVLRPVSAEGGVVAPWFGQPGFGVQYRLPDSVARLIDAGFLERVGP